MKSVLCVTLSFMTLFLASMSTASYVNCQQTSRIIGVGANLPDPNADIVEVDFQCEGNSLNIKYVVAGMVKFAGTSRGELNYVHAIYFFDSEQDKECFASIMGGDWKHSRMGWYLEETPHFRFINNVTKQSKTLSHRVEGSVLTITGLTLDDIGNRRSFYASASSMYSWTEGSELVGGHTYPVYSVADVEPRAPSGKIKDSYRESFSFKFTGYGLFPIYRSSINLPLETQTQTITSQTSDTLMPTSTETVTTQTTTQQLSTLTQPAVGDLLFPAVLVGFVVIVLVGFLTLRRRSATHAVEAEPAYVVERQEQEDTTPREFCYHCGLSMPMGAEFCKKCGKKQS